MLGDCSRLRINKPSIANLHSIPEGDVLLFGSRSWLPLILFDVRTKSQSLLGGPMLMGLSYHTCLLQKTRRHALRDLLAHSPSVASNHWIWLESVRSSRGNGSGSQVFKRKRECFILSAFGLILSGISLHLMSYPWRSPHILAAKWKCRAGEAVVDMYDTE